MSLKDASQVIIAVEDKGKRPGRIRLNKVKDASAQSLIPEVKASVQPKSKVCTDDWNGYNFKELENWGRTVEPNELFDFTQYFC